MSPTVHMFTIRPFSSRRRPPKGWMLSAAVDAVHEWQDADAALRWGPDAKQFGIRPHSILDQVELVVGFSF